MKQEKTLNGLIKEVDDFRKLVTRPLSPLKAIMYHKGMFKYCEKYGLPNLSESIVVCEEIGAAELMLSKKGMLKSIEVASRLLSNKEKMLKLFKRIEKDLDEILEDVRASAKETDDIAFIKKVDDNIAEISGIINVLSFLDAAMTKKLKGKQVKSSRKTEIQEMNEEIMKMISKKVERKKIVDFLKENYGWIRTYDFYMEPPTEEDFENIIESCKNTKRTGDEGIIDEVASQIIYYRELRTNAMRKTSFYVQDRMKELAKKKGLTLLELCLLLTDEIVDILKGKDVDRNEIMKRKKGFVYYFDEGEAVIFSGKEPVSRMMKEIYKDKFKGKLKGTIANKGITKGRVRKVLTYNDFDKVQEGDILVATMTDPAFTPLVSKIRAIVTDEGGLSCHAAIISREFNIPCIVGTKMATKVLKDGDKVLVDATKGTVEKIS